MAQEYIEVALKLFLEEKYYSVLTLAGAADEILGDKLESIGKTSALKDEALGLKIFKNYLGLKEKIKPGKEIDFLNTAKNSCKHGKSKDKRSFEFTYHGDIKVEAENRLEMAIKNYERVDGELSNFMNKFLMRNFNDE